MVSWDMWDARNDRIHNNGKTRQKQIEAALDAEIREIHEFGRQNQFLPKIAKHFFETEIEDILKRMDYQKRIWRRLGERYLTNDEKRMARNPQARRLWEWLVPGSSKGRRKVRNRPYLHNRE